MTSARPVDPPQAAAALPCRLDVPDVLEGAARYAVEELLRPLGLRPDWKPDSESETGLWYGMAGSEAPKGWLRLEMLESTASFLQGSMALRVASVGWHRSDTGRIPVLFEGNLEGAFDPIAGAFYLLSGRQEHVLRVRDEHGRFPGEASLQSSLGIERTAPVDDMRDALAGALERHGIRLHRRRWHGRPWALCPTHDVDYTRKWRPGIVWREAVQYAILNRLHATPARRLARLRSAVGGLVRQGDPYRNAMNRIPVELARAGGAATWFFKAGAHGPRDVGYRLGSRSMRNRVLELQRGGHEIGLHPSYHAFSHERYLRAETEKLARAFGVDVRSVRTHYLRWDPATTPDLMERTGFRIDSTLGFADRAGFRHGTTMPFRIWDWQRGAPGSLWELPLGVMESALFNRQGLDRAIANVRTRELADTCRRHGGVLVGLWHTTLWDELDCPGWGDHFVGTLRHAVDGGAAILSLADALTTWAPA